MITNDNKLEIFERFIQLPKKTVGNTVGNTVYITTTVNTVDWVGGGLNVNGVSVLSELNKRKSLFSKLKTFFTPKLNPRKFFGDVKGNLAKIHNENVERQKKFIEDLRKQTMVTGQTAFSENLIREENRINLEMSLFEKNLPFYIEESDVVNFASKDKTGRTIKLTWMKNFIKLIPPEVIEKLNYAQSLDLFENFVIMHYDPESKGIQKIDRERDPILFGVTSYSRRLYFIADWIDEYCDLTLNKLLTTIDTEKSERILVAKNIVKFKETK